MISRRHALAVLALAVAAGGCRTGPRSLVSGEDACAYCRMTIDDVRFGALVVTARGRLQTFDSIECVAAFVAALPASESPRGVWVANFEDPAQWVEATTAHYLQGSQLRSPMGRDVAAFAADAKDASLVARYGGRALSWTEVTALAATPLSTSSVGAPHAHAH